MLHIYGLPSRASLFNALNLRNSFVVPQCPEIKSLYKLIETEDSPFKISRQGKDLVDAVVKQFPELKEYKEPLMRTLAIRVL